MAPDKEKMEEFVINTVLKNPGIRRTKLKDLIRNEFDIGHAASLSTIDKLAGSKEIIEKFQPPNWKRYYSEQ